MSRANEYRQGCLICDADVHDYSVSYGSEFDTTTLSNSHPLLSGICEDCMNTMAQHHGLIGIISYAGIRKKIIKSFVSGLERDDLLSFMLHSGLLQKVVDHPKLKDMFKELDDNPELFETEEGVDKASAMFSVINRITMDHEEEQDDYFAKYLSLIAAEVLVRRYTVEAEIKAIEDEVKSPSYASIGRLIGESGTFVKNNLSSIRVYDLETMSVRWMFDRLMKFKIEKRLYVGKDIPVSLYKEVYTRVGKS